jgi:hypothetical protein
MWCGVVKCSIINYTYIHCVVVHFSGVWRSALLGSVSMWYRVVRWSMPSLSRINHDLQRRDVPCIHPTTIEKKRTHTYIVHTHTYVPSMGSTVMSNRWEKGPWPRSWHSPAISTHKASVSLMFNSGCWSRSLRTNVRARCATPGNKGEMRWNRKC